MYACFKNVSKYHVMEWESSFFHYPWIYCKSQKYYKLVMKLFCSYELYFREYAVLILAKLGPLIYFAATHTSKFQ